MELLMCPRCTSQRDRLSLPGAATVIHGSGASRLGSVQKLHLVQNAAGGLLVRASSWEPVSQFCGSGSGFRASPEPNSRRWLGI